jgi:hypothetical protein
VLQLRDRGDFDLDTKLSQKRIIIELFRISYPQRRIHDQ